jgi:hypothetical protein
MILNQITRLLDAEEPNNLGHEDPKHELTGCHGRRQVENS